jgi:iron complex outermembrane receptor protein
VKKNSDQIVEAISAEDIGKLPDTTIAESLARLPGVTTQRDRNGDATNISIRGLGPDFNGYLLNGREQTSTGDSRAVDLSVYPSELIASATVYKTADAGLMTAGLAGTIDNRLIDPLAFSERKISLIGEKTQTGRGLPVRGNGNRVSLSYIDQFADRKIGIALGFVKADGNKSSLVTNSWSGTPTINGTSATGKLPFGGGLGFETDRITDKRNGLSAILEFKPNKNFSSEIDLYKADIQTYTKKNILTGGMPGNVSNATVDAASGQITSGTYDLGANPNGIIDRAEGLFDTDTLHSFGWKNSVNFSDSWRASFDVSHNTAKRVERDIEVYAGITTADTLNFTLPVGAQVPTITFGTPGAYTSPGSMVIRDQTGWSGIGGVAQAGYDKGPTTQDKLDALRLDFTHDLADNGLFSALEFGGNVSKRQKDRTAVEALIVSSTGNGADPIPFPAGSYVINNVGGTGVDLLTFDPQASLFPGAKLQPKFNDDILSKTWNVVENVSTAYGKLDIDTQLGSVPVRGNVGMQVVYTNQYSDGFRADATSAVSLTNPATGLTRNGTHFTDYLPSLNMVGDLGSGMSLRFGAGVQIARPSLTDMRNSFAVGTNVTAPCVDANGTPTTPAATCPALAGSGGNAYLKPFKAKALDVSFEKYFGTRGYLSAALFYKRLDTYIVPLTIQNYDFQQAANAVGITALPPGVTTWNGVYTNTVNGTGGNLKGIELSASMPFNLLTHWLEGFGITASYSNTTSSVKLPNTLGQNPSQAVTQAGSIALPGLSHINDKAELYYERGGFSSFVAINSRSQYIGSVANTTIGGYPALIRIEGQTWVSAQLGYEVQEGWLKGLGLRLEGNNLNHPKYTERKYDGSINTQNKTGASVDLRVSYKL